MNPTSDNPYAPPAAEDLAVAQDNDRGWCVVDGKLLIRDGAELPEIDFHGREGCQLIRQDRIIHSPNGFSGLFWVLPAIASAIRIPFGRSKSFPLIEFIAGALILMLVFYVLHRRTCVRGKFYFFTDVIRKKRGRIRDGVSLLLLGGVMSGVLTIWYPLHADPGIGMVITLMTLMPIQIGLAFRSLDSIVCTAYSDGWFHLGGIKKPVIRQLEILANSSHAAAS